MDRKSWHGVAREENLYEFKEKVDEGIKVIWDGEEEIETNYLSMEYYKRNM